MKHKINPVLKELIIGIILFGIVCQIIGAFFTKDQLRYALSLWLGCIGAVAWAIHMYYTLDRALDMDEGNASKAARNGYMIRYGVITLLLGICALSGYINPVVTFLGLMGLKAGAYMQPAVHKILCRMGLAKDLVSEAPVLTDEDFDVSDDEDDDRDETDVDAKECAEGEADEDAGEDLREDAGETKVTDKY